VFIVTAALTQSGMALAYASVELRKSRDLALLAVRANEHAVNAGCPREGSSSGSGASRGRPHGAIGVGVGA
jgi:hypothetical protein